MKDLHSAKCGLVALVKSIAKRACGACGGSRAPCGWAGNKRNSGEFYSFLKGTGIPAPASADPHIHS
ncbi:hypothetical protein A0H81_08542 [Grifola frondosa]|uniref:Uncharacterized protein n=1 Tax=Grifola frondosa TaxID=5627 RepID=A0A1C7M8X8_GRIFR|nr:hypothetical protein A0H81_08542 [Grifola frondosa]